MHYFRMNRDSAIRAKQEIWRRLLAANQVILSFSENQAGGETSLWTPDPAGETLLRIVLFELGIPYEGSNTQHVFPGTAWRGKHFSPLIHR